MENKIVMSIGKDDWKTHVKRMCAQNLRDEGIKICLTCPFKNYALREMKKLGLKMPDEKRLAELTRNKKIRLK